MLKTDKRIEMLYDPSVLDKAQLDVFNVLGGAFGDEPGAFIAAEASSSVDTSRPFDILLGHPAVGILAVEVKAWSPGFIDRIEGGIFFLRGKPLGHNPLEQAKRAMFCLQSAFDRMRGRMERPLFLSVVAMPNLPESSKVLAGVPSGHYLFSEDLADPERLRAKVEERARSQMRSACLSAPLTPAGLDGIRGLLGNRSLLNHHRGDRELRSNSLGALLDMWEGADQRLTREQETISRLPVRGFPRVIRGVAGSGKSLVLARMASRHIAKFHNRPGDLGLDAWAPVRTGILCFNRSLVPVLKDKLARAYRQLTFRDLPDGAVEVFHLEGLRSRLQAEGLVEPCVGTPFRQRSAQQVAALANRVEEDGIPYDATPFDALFVDEAQDLSEDDIRLLVRILRRDAGTGECCLILFYDDAQNIYGNPRPVWKDLGLDVARGDRSQVMKVCHRNSREIVGVALNVLIGSHCPSGAASGAKAFAGVDELLKSGLASLDEERGMRVQFAARSGDVPVFTPFQDADGEAAHLLSEVERLLTAEEVRPSDILLLFRRNHRCQKMADILLQGMSQGRLPIQGVVRCFNKIDVDGAFQREGHITVSSIHGAKGCDAAVTFLGGVDCFDGSITDRALFYVAATRARHLLCLSSGGDGPLVEETLAACEAEKRRRARAAGEEALTIGAGPAEGRSGDNGL